MKKLVVELKKLVRFKDTVAAGDIVLIAAKKPQMLVYARIIAIARDESKRDEWWQVAMYILSLPPQKVSWILRTEQMTGREIFTMEGEERFMQAVDFGPDLPEPTPAKQEKRTEKTSLRRVK
jgi:hypothetical protein